MIRLGWCSCYQKGKLVQYIAASFYLWLNKSILLVPNNHSLLKYCNNTKRNTFMDLTQLSNPHLIWASWIYCCNILPNNADVFYFSFSVGLGEISALGIHSWNWQLADTEYMLGVLLGGSLCYQRQQQKSRHVPGSLISNANGALC